MARSFLLYRVGWLPAVVLLSVSGPLYGNEALSNRAQAPHVTVTLLSETAAIEPGVPFTVGLRFELEEHWHVYWLNPGDSGQQPRVTWRLPVGFQAGKLQWPAPSRIRVEHLVNFGYEDEVVLLAQITPPVDLPADGMVQLAAKVDWLVCKEMCIPGSAELGFTLSVAETVTIDPQVQSIFDTYRDRLPIGASELGWRVSAQRHGEMLEIKLTPTGGRTAHPRSVVFFPEQPGLIDNAAEQRLERRADSSVLSVRLQGMVGMPGPDRLKGVLAADDGWSGPGSYPAMQIDTPLKSRQ